MHARPIASPHRSGFISSQAPASTSTPPRFLPKRCSTKCCASLAATLHTTTAHTPMRGAPPTRGFSLVEMLVALSIGLVLLSGATVMFVSQLNASRRLAAGLRMQQDLSAASYLIARRIARDGLVPTSDGSSFTTATQWRLSNGAIQMKAPPAAWQSLTDVDTMRVTALAIEPTVSVTPMGSACTPACATASTCPRMVAAAVDILIDAQAASDAHMRRQMRDTVRLRNPLLIGSCP